VRNRGRLFLLAAVVAGVAIVWLSPLRQHLTRDEVRQFVESVRAAWYAPLLLIAMYAVGCVFAVPASLFIVAAGAVWGWALGGTFAMVGGVLGAVATFYVGRSIGGSGDPKRKDAAPRLDRFLRNAGFRSLLIARLLPVFPFAVLNYGAGIARVNSTAFVLSTVLGLIPSNYVFAWSADELFNGTLTGRDLATRLFLVATVSIVAVVIPSAVARATRAATRE
jgi:uncharacterized membrane protein YdjX (TVP38/TMEM64 family)